MYKNSSNFSVTSCFLCTVSADTAYTGKALKMQYKRDVVSEYHIFSGALGCLSLLLYQVHRFQDSEQSNCTRHGEHGIPKTKQGQWTMNIVSWLQILICKAEFEIQWEVLLLI